MPSPAYLAWKAMRLYSGLSGFVGPEDVEGAEAIVLLSPQSSSSSTADNLRSGPSNVSNRTVNSMISSLFSSCSSVVNSARTGHTQWIWNVGCSRPG
eukprot:3486454-Heterocapsa_arctica.AAC.1